MYDEFEDPLGHGGGLDEDDGDEILLDPVARLPQTPGCEQPCEKRPGGEPVGEPCAKMQKSDVSADQLAIIQENRRRAIARKRARDDASCREKWAEHWNGFDDAQPVQSGPDEGQDLRQQVIDLCLAIQVDDGGTYTDSQKGAAEEICAQLDGADDLSDQDLLLKKRRLETPRPEESARAATQSDDATFLLAQELAALLIDDEEEAEGPGPQAALAAPPPLRRPRPGLDPRAEGLLKQLDSTHTIRTYRGLAWCGVGGCYAAYVGTSRPHVRELARPCQPPRAKGLDNLRRLRLDPREWPHPLKGWPDVATQQRRQQLISEGALL